MELALQVVPLIFISLCLDLPRKSPEEEQTRASETRIKTGFELVVVTLGLLAFMVSLYAIGSEEAAAPEPWMRVIVIVALSFAMAASFSQVLLRFIRKTER